MKCSSRVWSPLHQQDQLSISYKCSSVPIIQNIDLLLSQTVQLLGIWISNSFLLLKTFQFHPWEVKPGSFLASDHSEQVQWDVMMMMRVLKTIEPQTKIICSLTRHYWQLRLPTFRWFNKKYFHLLCWQAPIYKIVFMYICEWKVTRICKYSSLK